MKYVERKGGRLIASALVASFLLTMASPGIAAGTATPVIDPKPTLAAAASSKAESLSPEALSSPAQTAPASDSADTRFLKTGKGKVAFALLVAATGFTVYSKYHDRIKSVIR